MIDYLIVGAGLAGATLAERLTNGLNKKVIVVDKRPHIAGNCYDSKNEHGVLIHNYGPHYFRTNSDKVLNYLSQFTEWIPAEYIVQSLAKGRFWSFPINLKTFRQLKKKKNATEEEFKAYLEKVRVPIENPKNSEEVIISQVGWELYKLFFEGYTLKQWKKHPRELDPSVCARIPIRTNANDRYFNDKYQVMPKDGYTAMVTKMLKDIQVELNFDYDKNWGRVVAIPKKTIYTGPIDAYYNYCYGPLPYRSLKFKQYTSHTASGFTLPTVQVNYPDKDSGPTRAVEVKHITKQKVNKTTVVVETPDDWEPGKEPYYPVPCPESEALFQKYKTLADQEKNTIFIGRLAMYRYYNMDQIVALALKQYEEIVESERG